jgi:2-haloacid dehalogenase
MNRAIDTIVFDLGGVLIDWNPRYLYRKIFKTEEEITWFLENICTSEWNDEQDGGRSFAEATRLLINKHPEHAAPIEAWYDRWQETIKGPVSGTVDILHRIKKADNYRLYALTNWSAETFPWALDNFDFLHWFEGIVVSGVERCKKPDEKIFTILISRYQIRPEQTLFIDDNATNISAAKQLGFHTIHFQSPIQLKTELSLHGIEHD